jgi:hypothetical protein
MKTPNADVFEFDTLEQLWSRVKQLKGSEHLQVRRVWPGGSQGAQGAIIEIEAEGRFKGFETYVARHMGPFEQNDQTLFTIHRNPHRWATRRPQKWIKGGDRIEIESGFSVDHGEPVWIVQSNLGFDKLPVEFRDQLPQLREAASMKLFNTVSEWAERYDFMLVE